MLRRVAVTSLLTHPTIRALFQRTAIYHWRMASFPSASGSESDKVFQGLATYAEGVTGATTTAEERAEAAAMRSGGSDAVGSGGGGPTSPTDPDLPPVLIDAEGTFKYVLISATPPGGGSVQHLVRGDLRAAYHKDAARPTIRLLETKVITKKNSIVNIPTFAQCLNSSAYRRQSDVKSNCVYCYRAGHIRC